MPDEYLSVKLDCAPTPAMTHEWGVYEQDGSSVVRYRDESGQLYEDCNGIWFRLDLK